MFTKWYRQQNSGHKLTTEQSRALRLFGAWRAAVWRAEAQAEGRLLTLIAAASYADADGDNESQITLSQFVYEQFGYVMPPIPKPISRQDIVRRVCRDWELLPGWMRAMRVPRHLGGQEEQDDDE